MAAGGARGRGGPPRKGTAKGKGKAKPAPRKRAPAAKSARPTRPPAARAESRRRRNRRDLTRRLVVAAVVLAVAGTLVFLAASRNKGAGDVIERLEAGPGNCRYDAEHDGTAADQERHITNATFEVDPPAGGAHSPTPAAPGFYRTGDVPEDSELVHAMEHGFVVLWYSPNPSPDDERALAGLSDRFGRELILVPRPSLEGGVAVTAWHRRLLCERLDPETVALFTTSYKDQGPEKGFL